MAIDFAIVTALPKERFALTACLDSCNLHSRTSPSGQPYEFATLANGVQIAFASATQMGQLACACLVRDVLADLNPLYMILTGIAAGIGSDCEPGDIIVSDRIVDYEVAKITATGWKRDYQYYNVDRLRLLKWTQRWTVLPDTAIAMLPQRPDKLAKKPKVIFGHILSGNKVVADQSLIDELVAQVPKAAGLEMESAGLAAACHSRGFNNFIMAKGICDRANRSKNDQWQRYAATAAAAYIVTLLADEMIAADLSNPSTPAAFRHRTFSFPTRINEITDASLSLQADEVPDVVKDLAGEIVKQAVDEGQRCVSGMYKTTISLGHHFLLRARKLFGRASKIAAINLDTVSQFWTDEANQSLAMEYLRSQGAADADVKRLFVFSTAESAHHHAVWLDRHAQRYKNVFLCSQDTYTRKLREFQRDTSDMTDTHLKYDFALLDYPEGPNCPPLNAFAKLTEDSLEFESIDEGNWNGTIALQRFRSWMDALSEIKTPRPRDGIVRWRESLYESDKWSGILEEMFGERTMDVVHMVLFKRFKEPEEVREVVGEIKANMLRDARDPNSFQRKYGLQDIWFGASCDWSIDRPRDGLLHGAIEIDSDPPFPHLLMMRFGSQEGLRNYYADQHHSEMRRKLYGAIGDDRFEYMYKAGTVGELSDRHNQPMAFEFIEALAAKYLQRHDYRSDESIRQLVKREPFQVPAI